MTHVQRIQLRQSEIRSQIAAEMGALVINGQAAVSSGSPKIEDVINSLDAPTNPSDVATWKDYITAYDAAVDGKYAVTDAEVRPRGSTAWGWKLARPATAP